jgi:hypothetical protein
MFAGTYPSQIKDLNQKGAVKIGGDDWKGPCTTAGGLFAECRLHSTNA